MSHTTNHLEPQQPPTRQPTASPKATAPPKAVFHDVGELAHDIVSLAELQGALLKDDLDQARSRVTWVAILLATSLVVLVCSLPIALVALAYVFASYGWSLAAAFGWSALCGAGLALVVGLSGWMMWRSSPAMFARSKTEFNRNVSWLKQVLSKRRQSASAG